MVLGTALVLVLLSAACTATRRPVAGTSVAGSSGGPSPTGTHAIALGAAVAAGPGQSPAQAIAGLESTLGRTLSYDRDYLDWDDPIPNALMRADHAAGRTTVLSIRPTLRASPTRPIPWASIAAGDQDAQIRRQAEQVRAFGAPVLIAFHHEADLAHGFGTAAQFTAAFRHFVTVFRSVGVPEARFVLILSPTAYREDPTAWYPGSDYVDWIADDPYNFGSCHPGLSGWRSLASAAGPFYAWASRQGKPLMLAEFGTAADPSDPGRQAAWLRQAAATMAGWPRLQAVLYFDEVGTCDWRLAESATTLAAFRAFARSAAANAAPTARLVAVSSLRSAGPVALDAAASTGADDPTGSGVVSWRFAAGDGSAPVTGRGQPGRIEHVYRDAGQYQADLVITDGGGATASTTTSVTIA